MILITTGLKPKTQHVESIRKKPKKNWFLETVFGFSKKKKLILFFRDFLERVEACLIEKVLINSI